MAFFLKFNFKTLSSYGIGSLITFCSKSPLTLTINTKKRSKSFYNTLQWKVFKFKETLAQSSDLRPDGFGFTVVMAHCPVVCQISINFALFFLNS